MSIHQHGDWLDVDDVHRVRFSAHGNPKGLPLLLLHGGPGSGARAEALDPVDLDHFHAIAFDQRGAGQSRPGGCLRNNTTELLLEDIEALREHYAIDRWLLCGGSWGSTLALLYAQHYPSRVAGVVIRGTFLARREDVEWFFGPHGVARENEAAYRELCTPAGDVADGAGLVTAYARITSTDGSLAQDAAAAWLRWDTLIATGDPVADNARPSEQQLNAVRIASHYAANGFFLGGDGVELDFAELQRVSCVIVHGSNDRVCRPQASERLHEAWPGAELRIVDGGHIGTDPKIRQALRAALQDVSSAVAHGSR